MWWAGSSRADVYVGTRAVQLLHKGRVLLSSPCDGVDAGLEQLRLLVLGLPRALRFRVWLSGGLCRPFLLPEIAGASSERDWRQIAESLAEDASGLTGPCRVWLDTGQRSPHLAVALASSLPERLLSVLGANRVLSLRPWWAEALRAYTKQKGGGSALAICDCDSLTLLLADGNTYKHAQTYSLLNAEEQAVLDRALTTANWPMESVPVVRLNAFNGSGGMGDADRNALVFGQRVAA